MNESCLLIVFAKNLVYGEVKTRLAASVGKQQAFEIYTALLQHTFVVTKQLAIQKTIYYAGYIEENDIWQHHFNKAVQQGTDLGDKMCHAFKEAFSDGFTKPVLIGTDCPAIDLRILQDAFAALDKHDIVIGPATDGGYYLIGMKALQPKLFENIAWSTSAVLETTLLRCDELQLSYYLLPVLTDIDEEKDLQHFFKSS